MSYFRKVSQFKISSCDKRRIRVASLYQFVVSVIRRHGEMRNDTYLLHRYVEGIDHTVAVSYLLSLIVTRTTKAIIPA